MLCKECKKEIENHYICPYCHTAKSIATNEEADNLPSQPERPHSAVVAGFLQLFLGMFGIGRFYLGYKKIGATQLIFSLLSFGIIGFLWGFSDGIAILKGNVKYDAFGNELI